MRKTLRKLVTSVFFRNKFSFLLTLLFTETFFTPFEGNFHSQPVLDSGRVSGAQIHTFLPTLTSVASLNPVRAWKLLQVHFLPTQDRFSGDMSPADPTEASLVPVTRGAPFTDVTPPRKHWKNPPFHFLEVGHEQPVRKLRAAPGLDGQQRGQM